MKITDVRIKLQDDAKLRAFASVVFDDEFLVKDLRVILATDGKLFLSMPSRKVVDKCPACGEKNHLLAKFCNECGSRLPDNRKVTWPDGSEMLDPSGRPKLFADIAHPLTSDMRLYLEDEVLSRYQDEREGGKVA